MSGIFWLASYPKSGNTWLRAFLCNYRRNRDRPVDINELDFGPIANERYWFDETIGISSSDLCPEEIDRYRPFLYEQLCAGSDEPLFIKVHDAYACNADQRPIFPKELTAGVIYLIRNPLDVVVSFTHHAHKGVAAAIEDLCCDAFTLGNPKDCIYEYLPQKLGNWSQHVSSWTEEEDLNILTVRYEDMVGEPDSTFRGIVRFLGFSPDPERLRKAISFSSFEQLQSQEAVSGFKERSPNAVSFFRTGRVGSWKGLLTEDQVAEIIGRHGKTMRRFGYLTSDTKTTSLAKGLL